MLVPIPCIGGGLAMPLQPVGRAGARNRAADRVKVKGDVLGRVRAAEQQIGLSRAQHAINVQGAFQVSADHQAEVQGGRIVLIDLRCDAGCLLAGALLRARQLDALVFARVVETGSRPI
jgi:hypothetical protein